MESTRLASTTIPKIEPNVIITAAILLLLLQWVIQYTYRLESSLKNPKKKKTILWYTHTETEREANCEFADHQNEIGSSCSIYFGYCAVVHFVITHSFGHINMDWLMFAFIQPRFYMVLFHFRLTHRNWKEERAICSVMSFMVYYS